MPGITDLGVKKINIKGRNPPSQFIHPSFIFIFLRFYSFILHTLEAETIFDKTTPS